MDCFHILYVDWYWWEDSCEARWAQSDYLWATQPPPPRPPNSPKCTFVHIGAHIWNTGGYYFSLLYICLFCDEVLLPCKFGNPGFDVRAPRTPPPPNMNCISIWILTLKLQIASLFHIYMYIDKGERIAGEHDRLSLITESPPPPQITKNVYVIHILAYM